MSPSIRPSGIGPHAGAVLGGLGYVAALSVAGWLLGFSIAPGRSLLGSPLPVFTPAGVGMVLVGGLTAVLRQAGLRSPVLVLFVGSVATLYAEATSLRPTTASLLGVWPTLAVLAVGIAGVEYGFRRDRDSPIRRSASTERALLGGGLAACLLLFALSLRGVGPATALSVGGSIPSVSALEAVISVFGPPAMLVWLSIALLLRRGLLAPLVSIPAVGALLASPLGFALSLFAATSPLLFLVVLTLAAGEYALRIRSSFFRPRSLVG